MASTLATVSNAENEIKFDYESDCDAYDLCAEDKQTKVKYLKDQFEIFANKYPWLMDDAQWSSRIKYYDNTSDIKNIQNKITALISKQQASATADKINKIQKNLQELRDEQAELLIKRKHYSPHTAYALEKQQFSKFDRR